METELYLGDCLEVMPRLAKVDYVITDPPYGCGKALWDNSFPVAWYEVAKKLTNNIIVITGSEGLKDSIRLIGDDLFDVIAGRNLNGMTRSAAGFSNWLAAAIAGKVKQGPTFFEFAVGGEKIAHPSPKPLQYMLKLVERTTNQGDTVLDPFMGSGTTGVACKLLHRRFVGIEKDAHYFDIATKRINDVQAPAITDEGVFLQPEQAGLFEVTHGTR